MTDASTAPRIAPQPSKGDQPSLNIFRTLGHNHELLKGFLALGSHLLRGDTLPAREREIVILRTGWRCGSEYEFGQHTVIGLQAGLTDEEIARLADAREGSWSDPDHHLVDMVDELCSHDMVSEPTWHALASRWNDAQLLELVVLTGYYRLVSGLLNSAGVALERDTPGWPEGSSPVRRAARDSS
ncbi:MAG TPA: carboxymuconolactone decarboxylase family protein [Mycobacteriales bacterium]|nr:carboxymuconolactone decarboxylase family protein [Mycobacteriales bacterium]